MGLGIVLGLVKRGYPERLIRIVEKSPERLKTLSATTSVEISDVMRVSFGDVLLLAVKPQDFGPIAETLRPLLSPSNLVISIMAGISTDRLRLLGKGMPFVRAMPNTPALVNESMTTFYAEDGVEEASLVFVERLLATVGKVSRTQNEDLIDAATAIAGSGPAYSFYLAEQMEAAACELGFDPVLARKIVVQTLSGAAKLLTETGESPAVLRSNVTSPGGTTEAACRHFDVAGMSQIVRQGCFKAYERSKELSGNVDK